MTAPTVLAHRGFAGTYPENTVAAVCGAVVDGIVTDYPDMLGYR